jgi:beta-phosphoglucomutase
MISAVIFDLNGTVLSDEDEYGLAFKRVLESLGADVESDQPHVSGIGVEENWPELLKKYKVKTDKSAKELAVETQNEYRKQIADVTVRDGFEEFVQSLKDDGVPTALATSNTWGMVDEVFQKLDIEKYFDVITTREEVIFTKPDPEIFRITAQKLQADSTRCVVFEDSEAGIKAAKKAGMKTVGVAQNKEHAKSLKDANLVIFDYNDISADKLINS